VFFSEHSVVNVDDISCRKVSVAFHQQRVCNMKSMHDFI